MSNSSARLLGIYANSCQMWPHALHLCSWVAFGHTHRENPEKVSFGVVLGSSLDIILCGPMSDSTPHGCHTLLPCYSMPSTEMTLSKCLLNYKNNSLPLSKTESTDYEVKLEGWDHKSWGEQIVRTNVITEPRLWASAKRQKWSLQGLIRKEESDHILNRGTQLYYFLPFGIKF